MRTTTQNRKTSLGRVFCLMMLVVAWTIPVAAQNGTENGEWRYWGGDEGSTRYSPLDQIDAGNVADLEVAWRWKAANYGPTPDFIYRATPLYVNGTLYTLAGQRRTVVAIDPATMSVINPSSSPVPVSSTPGPVRRSMSSSR